MAAYDISIKEGCAFPLMAVESGEIPPGAATTDSAASNQQRAFGNIYNLT